MTTSEGITQLYEAAKAADDAFQAALEHEYGKDAGDMRYAAVLPTELAMLRLHKHAADERYFRTISTWHPA